MGSLRHFSSPEVDRLVPAGGIVHPNVAAVVAWGRIVYVGGRVPTIGWVVVGYGRPDLATLDGLARMQLAARRLGGAIRITEMCPDLAELVDLAGLRRELTGEAEEGEDAIGVEERVNRGDPPA